jgi:molybdate-binding protein/DNA-binding XRE family transcriptional regulator
LISRSGLQLNCSLRQRRSDADLSQSALAERAGISRQALIAIESGRQIPSTATALALARVLGCSVEDLFQLPVAPGLTAVLAAHPEAPRTRRLALALVDGTWAAHRIESGDRPGDALLLDGGDTCRTVSVEPLSELSDLEHNVLAAGCAPLLGVLTGRLGRRFQDARATWIGTNSTLALELLAKGLVHVAGLHLAETRTPGGHTAVVRQTFRARAMTIVNLARWRQGLVVAEGNPLGIGTVADLARPDVRFARRDAGASAQKLVERLLAGQGAATDIVREGPVARGHAEVARWVRLGLADAGVAVEAAALAEGLDFVPLAEERFDLVVPTHRLEAKPVARFLALIESHSFRKDASQLAGYDLSTSGHASTVAAG